MFIKSDNYALVSGNFDREQGLCLEWTKIEFYYYTPGQKRGHGVEPHYHDLDEFWLFGNGGEGEVWLDGEHYTITPNTLVYTPAGVIHRFQMFHDFETVALATRYEGQKRPGHLIVAEVGPAHATAPGFVVMGTDNDSRILEPGARCLLSELRYVTRLAGSHVGKERLTSNEHWIVVEGSVELEVDGVTGILGKGDMALLRAGALRQIQIDQDVRLALAREKEPKQ